MFAKEASYIEFMNNLIRFKKINEEKLLYTLEIKSTTF